ncbi:hypothetical protein AB870_26275 [Pandoraea faecigallinarum]|uniref:hypothetical protein n=1 Tax=Pandoraea faecigallinarum TaxID=656179 RepID=UPI00064C467F|nr:hypothetical protein [Pandoraea faecigallinarum]AOX47783.1 hypothetical protein AB870_26275 [Pandoraea faecigallinarum]
MKTKTLKLTINGKVYGPTAIPEHLMMVDYLHEYARLPGDALAVDSPFPNSDRDACHALASCVSPGSL